MKTLTVRLPDELVAEIDAESKERNMSKSDVVRERLQSGARNKRDFSPLNGIADLVGSVDGATRGPQCTQEALPESHGLWPTTFSLMPASSSRY